MMKMMKFLRSIFRKSKPELFNVYHPEIAGLIEEAFTCEGVRYFRMKETYNVPTGRYKFIDAFLHEHEMRMTLKMMEAYLDKGEAILNGKQGTIRLSDIAVLFHNMRTHAKMAFLPETIERLASVVYFDDTEDLRDYDMLHAEKKIQAWRRDEKMTFFLTSPIRELLNLTDSSLTYLPTYIQWANETIKDLTSDLLTPSEPSSSSSAT